MADQDTIEVTFTKQKVYHDGTNMQVKKAGDTANLPRTQVANFLAEKVIDVPEGWSEEIADKNSQAVADGGFTAGPADGSGGDDLSQLDHDGNGEPGGSEPHEPPALTGKNKAELLAIAEAEGVDIAEGATNAQIIEAIEAARAADDEGAPA